MHTHSPTCVKYALSRGGGNCRFGAPWPLVEHTTFEREKGLTLRRNHHMVNKYNQAMAVGLRHNHDLAFIGTKAKSLAIIFYLTNYATKVEDPAWKRLAVVKELVSGAGQGAGTFLTRVANRVFTERALSQVEVVAHLVGQKMDYGNQEAWIFLNVHAVYWHVYWRWQHLRRTAGQDTSDEDDGERILVANTGRKTALLEAYPHRGPLLAGMCLYDYMSVVTLVKRKNRSGRWGAIELDPSWTPASNMIQQLRRPGHHATVCVEGVLGMDFEAEDETMYRAAAVQHLGLFVPWEKFISEGDDDINVIWERRLAVLPSRIARLAGNVQLLRRSAEDARRDRKQWPAQSSVPQWMEDEDRDAAGNEEGDSREYCTDESSTAARLLDVFRRAVSQDQVTHGSPEIRSVIQHISRFEQAAPLHMAELMVEEPATRSIRVPGSSQGAETPLQGKLAAIKRQQTRLSRDREKTIQGIQGRVPTTTSYDAAINQVLNGFGEDDVEINASDTELPEVAGPSSRVELGPSTSFSEAGRQVAEKLTLNKRQAIAFRLIYRQMDRLRRDEVETSQFCLFVGGEGGTGKSRVVQAITDLFTVKGMSERLLVTATSGAAAAQINGVTIHAACQLSVDRTAATSRSGEPVNGEIQAGWRDKWLLIIDEVSMLGARTLYAVNQALRRLRGKPKNFGGIPIILMCGDFHQFRPVRDKSLLSSSSVEEWENDGAFTPEVRHQCMEAWKLWDRFTTVVLLQEQVRAAGDPVLQGLLSRIRKGEQDMNDLDLLNRMCYRPGQRIPWTPDLIVVTPLNRNRWNLNMEATIAFQRQRGSQMRIFLSEHEWPNGNPTEAEAIEMLSRGDDSDSAVPGIFMFVPGMPVAVNRNTHQGLKLVNGAHYTAVDVIIDRRFPGYRLDANTILHLGPPAGLLLTGATTQDLHFVDMPAKTILLLPMTATIKRAAKRSWQTVDTKRRGLPCTPAFACTDYKVQGRTLTRAALELRGTRMIRHGGEVTASACDAYSLYVQLSRCRTLADLRLISEVRREDFIDNRVPEEMLKGEERLERLSEATIAAAREET
jgi:hypothetical protein